MRAAASASRSSQSSSQPGAPQAREVPEPNGYRLENYRAPTPATLRGAKVIGTRRSGSDLARPFGQLCRRAAEAAATARPAGRERFGATSRAPIFPAASGCPTPATANSRPAWPIISRGAWTRRPMAIAPECSSSIVWRTAGCRGTRPSARSRSAIQTSPGIPKAPTAGSDRPASGGGFHAGTASGRIAGLC